MKNGKSKKKTLRLKHKNSVCPRVNEFFKVNEKKVPFIFRLDLVILRVRVDIT